MQTTSAVFSLYKRKIHGNNNSIEMQGIFLKKNLYGKGGKGEGKRQKEVRRGINSLSATLWETERWLFAFLGQSQGGRGGSKRSLHWSGRDHLCYFCVQWVGANFLASVEKSLVFLKDELISILSQIRLVLVHNVPQIIFETSIYFIP